MDMVSAKAIHTGDLLESVLLVIAVVDVIQLHESVLHTKAVEQRLGLGAVGAVGLAEDHDLVGAHLALDVLLGAHLLRCW